jgi:cytoskeletal protein CcmA (bactofilin family)
MTIPRLRYNRFRDEGGFSPPHDSRHHAEDLHDFHLPMAALHHAAASGGGVLRGLAVHGRLGSAELTVEEGVALDSAGRLIVLSGDGRADIGAAPDTGEHDEQPVPVRMPIPSEPGRYYLTMQFNLLLRANEGAIGRQEQAPWLRFRPVDGFADDASVVLAVVELASDDAGTPALATLDAGRPDLAAHRRSAGEAVGELVLAHGTATVTSDAEQPTASVGTAAGAHIRSAVGGGLSLTVARAEDVITLAAEQDKRFGRLDLQAAETVTAGALRVGEALTVSGATELADSLTVTGRTSTAGLTVTTDATLSGPVVVTGRLSAVDLRSSGRLQVSGTAEAARLAVTGSTTTAALTVTADATVGGTVGVTGRLTAGELRSTGRLQVSGALVADATATVAGSLNAGSVVTSGPLRVGGSLTVTGLVTTASERVHLVPQGGRVAVGSSNPLNDLHVQGGIGTGRTFQTAGSVTFYPPDGFAFFHIDNGPSGGRPQGRLRISHGGQPGSTELISVLQNGRVGIGQPQPAASLHVSGDRIRLSRGNVAGRFIELRADGSALDLDSRGGDLFINNHGAHDTRIRNLVELSSGRLKQEVAELPADRAEALLDELCPVTFRFRDHPETVRIGFVAEDMPAAIATADGEGYRPVDLLAVLAAVLRRQQQTVALLRDRLGALESSGTS